MGAPGERTASFTMGGGAGPVEAAALGGRLLRYHHQEAVELTETGLPGALSTAA